MLVSRTTIAALFAATAFCAPAFAQGGSQTGSQGGGAAAPAAAPAKPSAVSPAKPPAGDPVVAKVDGQEIHLSDVQAEEASLPAQMRALPQNVLYPMLLDQAIDRTALAIEARKLGLEKDPDVQAALKRARRGVLQGAMLRHEVLPELTEDAVKAAYEKEYAGKKGAEEVHAEHILVPTEAQAKDIIAQLDKGADFATLAKKYSTDTGSKQDGGDLGFFKKDEMVPAFADAAFSLKPGQITQTPVHTQFGWHVIKVLGTRVAPPPTLKDVTPQIRQQLLQQGVQQAVAKAKQGLTIERFNPDGSPMRATDTAEPPPAPKH